MKPYFCFRTRGLSQYGDLILLLRHVRNLHELGPHYIRAAAMDQEDKLEKRLGKDYAKAYQVALKRRGR